MRISVIIPVYNAEKYVARAVQSVLLQNEVEEVIFAEDGSLDNSLNICNSLQKINDKV
jgi:glycosyltransferase involved in cell wall biosynthesis|tara:strand:+ start:320 stop:493 length:174 start_codon:yes stop_codon:yes gene_type:complete